MVAALLGRYLQTHTVAILEPQGTIAHEQRNLMVIATLLMLVVVIPVFILAFTIVWKYREGNTDAPYDPDWDHNRTFEAIWWLVPFFIISVLGCIIWQSSYRLDPYKPLQATKKPLTVEVVALQWKWLFIYPEQHIASVNLVQFPVDTPINFKITADAPMNSFWIPQLGGQIYAMPGMTTQLHLLADKLGSYSGSSANLSGVGFADMKFIAKSTTEADFQNWVASTKQSEGMLDQTTYTQLAQPSENNRIVFYRSSDPTLFDHIVMQHMEMEHEGM
jgi:cytochrome o ubiquinol oxidase subunit 2